MGEPFYREILRADNREFGLKNLKDTIIRLADADGGHVASREKRSG
ncbi:MAG: hypothetical protein O8C66_07380 [Candidatus Methanoperedens sp.]|nr:hypothetical protein [Candidatus Methanoperedens sp.]MCZ7370316.1 hypothetical protein [Candidatus Methanoperedens sp.]